MKVEKVVGYYVRIEPRSLGDLGLIRTSDAFIEPDENKRMARYRELCCDIAEAVLELPDVGTADVRADREAECSFCGALWTMPENSSHNGGCCEKDEANYYMELEP